jgi:hypothetical protein
VKRQVHFSEPPNETENPFVRIQVEKNEVDLDPGDLGRLVDDINLEVRVDNVGGLNVGPVLLNVDLEDAKQVVEVTFQAQGKTDEGNDRPQVKFSWHLDDQAKERYWMLFTGQPDFMPRYTYQVRVLVKGSIFVKGQEWLGPLESASGNGPIMISVPTPTDPGVVTKDIVELPEADVTAKPAGRTPPPAMHRLAAGARATSSGPYGGQAERGDGGSRDMGWSLTPPSRRSGTVATKRKASTGATSRRPEDASDMFSSFTPTPPNS